MGSLYDSYISFDKALKFPQLKLFITKSDKYTGMCNLHYGDVHIGMLVEKHLNVFQDLITRIGMSGMRL